MISDLQCKNSICNSGESSSYRATPPEGYRATNQTSNSLKHRGSEYTTASTAPRVWRRADTAFPYERGRSTRDWNAGGSDTRRGRGRGQPSDDRIGSQSQEPFVTPEHAGDPENALLHQSEARIAFASINSGYNSNGVKLRQCQSGPT